MQFNKPDLTIADAKFWDLLFNQKKVYTLLPLFLGLISTFAFSPYNIWAVIIVTLTIFIYFIHRLDTYKRVFVATLFYFAAMNSATLSWLNFVMQDFGQLPFILSWAIEIIISLYLALPYAILIALSFKLTQKNKVSFILCLIPLSVVVADFIVGYLFTGFPWMYMGYSMINSPLNTYAPLIGVRGIDLVITLLAASFVLAITRRYVFFPIAGIIFIISFIFMQYEFTKSLDIEHNVTLVQGNIKQSVKWDPEQVSPTLKTYYTLSDEAFKNGDIVVWPESAIPLVIQNSKDFLSLVQERLNDNNGIFITGIQNYKKDEHKQYNSIIVMDSKSDLNNLNPYNKRHLVPFGEVVPFEDLLRPLGKIFNFPMSSFSRGDYKQDNLQVRDLKLIPSICYESIFPELMLSQDNKDTNGILMVSNDSWFGNTRGPLEHLDIARMRVLELQKPMIRVTNSGLSVFIDKKGEIVDEIEVNKEGVVRVTMQKVEGQTPYSKIGDFPLYILSLILLILSIVIYKKDFDPILDNLAKMVRP